jgi:importin subunit beta-1
VKLDAEFKEQIKTAILATLASPKALVRNQVANILSAIASIEIPRKEWDSLIPNLCNNSTSEDNNIKMASLTTLGYICEELDPEDLSNELKNSIILALTNNISDTGPIESSKLSIKALLYSVPYVSPNFQKPEERDFIMQKIFTACSINDEEVQEFGLHCLREISTQEYQSVQYYFDNICL